MPTPYKSIRYQKNPSLGPKHEAGRKMRDPRTGHWTYEYYTAADDFGVVTDVRGHGFDYDQTEGERP